ncbi:hypothetical protein CBR_g50100 [Chara braunii]|uniref:Uncharacterized protein n=1 Tax=Chara braunii TaxID=69332 RepID=A0A388M5Z1_CHABU|nr:hypothetical protein CBR_g50100 [Chara braunii]|eukprot:GBG90007.1 hypothetical protein CBR_g50100 [Chara braunii]
MNLDLIADMMLLIAKMSWCMPSAFSMSGAGIGQAQFARAGIERPGIPAAGRRPTRHAANYGSDPDGNLGSFYTLQLIASNCPLLETLVLEYPKLDDWQSSSQGWMLAVDALERGCRSLREVDLEVCPDSVQCEELTVELVTRFPLLTALRLYGTDTDDDSLRVILTKHPNLEFLQLTAEDLITDASLVMIGSKLKRLKTLEVGCCIELTEAGLKSLRLERKDLKVVVEE